VRRPSDVTVGDITLNKGELPIYPKDVTLISDGSSKIVADYIPRSKPNKRTHPNVSKFLARSHLFLVLKFNRYKITRLSNYYLTANPRFSCRMKSRDTSKESIEENFWTQER
jgi:hypothetical protein